MNAYIAVMDHPYFAVTGSDGRFSLKGLAAGAYTLEFWHEYYGVLIKEVNVGVEPQSLTVVYKK